MARDSGLPPRLSDRQQFVLAWMADAQDTRDERLREAVESRNHMARRRFVGRYGTPYEASPPTLSRAVAREFGEIEETGAGGEPDADLPEEPEELEELRRSLAARPTRGREYDERTTDAHRSTHSRTLRRLADRGLLDREILRRHSDGRYSLAFETLS